MQRLEPVEVKRRALATKRVVGTQEINVLRWRLGREILEQRRLLRGRRLLRLVARAPAVVRLCDKGREATVSAGGRE